MERGGVGLGRGLVLITSESSLDELWRERERERERERVPKLRENGCR